MTRLEARIRASALWGHDRLVHLELRDDGGVDVELKPSVRVAPDGDGLAVGEWGYTYHVLDADGQPICHAACQPDPKDR